jgi:hypothetical protein
VDIRLLDGAKEDLRYGWFFYERQAPGLDDRFLDAIEADVRPLLPDRGRLARHLRDPTWIRERLGRSGAV